MNDKDDLIVLTPSALVAFLSQVEELKDLDLVSGEEDGSISIRIGENVYLLEASHEGENVEVDEELFDTIDDINEEGYEELEDEGILEDAESIEGGIIKELVKTLAIGGLVRLTKNAIQDA